MCKVKSNDRLILSSVLIRVCCLGVHRGVLVLSVARKKNGRRLRSSSRPAALFSPSSCCHSLLCHTRHSATQTSGLRRRTSNLSHRNRLSLSGCRFCKLANFFAFLSPPLPTLFFHPPTCCRSPTAMPPGVAVVARKKAVQATNSTAAAGTSPSARRAPGATAPPRGAHRSLARIHQQRRSVLQRRGSRASAWHLEWNRGRSHQVHNDKHRQDDRLDENAGTHMFLAPGRGEAM